MCGADGGLVLIDPRHTAAIVKVYLAMLQLLGRRSERMLGATKESCTAGEIGRDDSVPRGRARPLLADAVLFGRGDGSRVAAIVRRLSRSPRVRRGT